jgi:hypothetical protein
MLLTLMSIKRKLLKNRRDAAIGWALARWLNRSFSDHRNRAAQTVGWYVARRLGESPQALLSASSSQTLRVEFKPHGGQISVQVMPADEDGRMLSFFAELYNSGIDWRLRFCPNCERFWYCAGRFDRRACSVACKVALWQKTPEGRAKKAEYMRRHRKTQRERERKQRLAGKRLKVSKSILAKLGK